MTDTRAAAERLRKHNACGKAVTEDGSPYMDDNDDIGHLACGSYWADVEKLADAYLAMTQADDEEPADEAWLLEQKEWDVTEHDWGTWARRPDIRCYRDPSRKRSLSWRLNYDTTLWTRHKVTRGMVRRLVAALGVGKENKE